MKVKQEPGTEDEICSFSGAVKQEKTEDGRRSACMVRFQWNCSVMSGGHFTDYFISVCVSLDTDPVDLYSFLNFFAWYKPKISFSN